jgi:hypothetical protein
MPVMSGRVAWSESPFGPDRMVVPIGSTWEKTKVDQKVIAGYRFSPKALSADIQYARLKTRLDIAAALYLLLVLIGALLPSRPASHSLTGILANISSAFADSLLAGGARWPGEHRGRSQTFSVWHEGARSGSSRQPGPPGAQERKPGSVV